MAEYKLDYTGDEINELLGQIPTINQHLTALDQQFISTRITDARNYFVHHNSGCDDLIPITVNENGRIPESAVTGTSACLFLVAGDSNLGWGYWVGSETGMRWDSGHYMPLGTHKFTFNNLGDGIGLEDRTTSPYYSLTIVAAYFVEDPT